MPNCHVKGNDGRSWQKWKLKMWCLIKGRHRDIMLCLLKLNVTTHAENMTIASKTHHFNVDRRMVSHWLKKKQEIHAFTPEVESRWVKNWKAIYWNESQIVAQRVCISNHEKKLLWFTKTWKVSVTSISV